MRSTVRSLWVSMAFGLAAVAAQAAGQVQVTFVQPEQFTDIRDNRLDIDVNLRELKRHLEALAARHVADGQSLTIEVLDVDLAGDIRYNLHLLDNVRVLTGNADWPRIKLRATLESAGQPVRRIEQTVADMAYLQRLDRSNAGDFLRYEKRMLEEWFTAQFGQAAAQ